jgi:hypothetical protein
MGDLQGVAAAAGSHQFPGEIHQVTGSSRLQTGRPVQVFEGLRNPTQLGRGTTGDVMGMRFAGCLLQYPCRQIMGGAGIAVSEGDFGPDQLVLPALW